MGQMGFSLNELKKILINERGESASWLEERFKTELDLREFICSRFSHNFCLRYLFEIDFSKFTKNQGNHVFKVNLGEFRVIYIIIAGKLETIIADPFKLLEFTKVQSLSLDDFNNLLGIYVLYLTICDLEEKFILDYWQTILTFIKISGFLSIDDFFTVFCSGKLNTHTHLLNRDNIFCLHCGQKLSDDGFFCSKEHRYEFTKGKTSKHYKRKHIFNWAEHMTRYAKEVESQFWWYWNQNNGLVSLLHRPVRHNDLYKKYFESIEDSLPTPEEMGLESLGLDDDVLNDELYRICVDYPEEVGVFESSHNPIFLKIQKDCAELSESIKTFIRKSIKNNNSVGQNENKSKKAVVPYRYQLMSGFHVKLKQFFKKGLFQELKSRGVVGIRPYVLMDKDDDRLLITWSILSLYLVMRKYFIQINPKHGEDYTFLNFLLNVNLILEAVLDDYKSSVPASKESILFNKFM
jgi:hypothetical protein